MTIALFSISVTLKHIQTGIFTTRATYYYINKLFFPNRCSRNSLEMQWKYCVTVLGLMHFCCHTTDRRNNLRLC